MTPEKIETLSQKFMMEALKELTVDFTLLSELSFDWNTYETLVWCGVAERELEQLIGPGETPCGTRFYYRLVNS
jgi:hypothetical protein